MSILEILEAHYPNLDQTACFISCGCGWVEENPQDWHLEHLAQVLEQHEREREAAAEAKHRREWADHISEWHATVGAPICHVDAVVQALRSDHVPFGKGATNGRD